MNKWVLVLFVSYISFNLSASSLKIRSIYVKNDQIVMVKTGIGVATLIQVPDPPHSVVVGDQASFKVEYLDNAITIKPLSANAKSNLYIYTDWRRYNVQLITTDEANADYVVYLKNPVSKTKPVNNQTEWYKFSNELQNDELKLKTIKLGKSVDESLFIEFELTANKNEEINPEWFWLTQAGESKAIHNLLLAGLKLSKGKKVKGTIQILKKDINEDAVLRLEMRRKKISFLTIFKVSSWKNLSKVQSY